MPKFAANLTMLFNEHDFLDRFAAAAKAGLKAVEFLFPYAYPTAEIKSRLDANGLQLVLHNLPAGNWDAGDRGIAVDPARVDEFRAGVAQASDNAKALGVTQLNCLAGKAPAGVVEAELRRTFVANLRFATAELKKAGLKLLIEPIKTFDIPGFYLSRSTQGGPQNPLETRTTPTRASRLLKQELCAKKTCSPTEHSTCRSNFC